MSLPLRWKALAAAVLAASATLIASPGVAAAPPSFSTIRPGEHSLVESKLRVNLVMVGYEPGSFDADKVIDGLPETHRPIVRVLKNNYGIHHEVGLEHQYEYVPRFAGDAFDNAFFRYLARTGTRGEAPPTAQFYNDQPHNILDVPGEWLYNDAAATERWLTRQATQRLGIPAGEHMVFLINWWGRPDFQFHAYQASEQADPDTGLDLGPLWFAQLISWGGSSSRTWFLDASAGPEIWQYGFEIETADLTGDGVTDHRLPPIWEYGNPNAYKSFDDLEGDLAKVIRYVALNALFTQSPLFDPTHFVPKPGGKRLFDIARFDGDPSDIGLEFIQPDVVDNQLTTLAPYYDVAVRTTDNEYTPNVQKTLYITGGAIEEDGCWSDYGPFQFRQLSCWFGARTKQFWPSAPRNDAVIRGMNFTLTDEDGRALGFPGWAEDNYVDGTPNVFATAVSLELVQFGWGGHTYRTLHSTGHMLGFSHGYDGYDSELGQIRPFTGNLFTLLGDEVQSPMGHLFNSPRFGVFDHDNLNRWMVGGLLNRANADTEAILASPDGGKREVQKALRSADSRFGESLELFAAGKLPAAARAAVEAYDYVQRAGTFAGVPRVEKVGPSSSAKLTASDAASYYCSMGAPTPGVDPRVLLTRGPLPGPVAVGTNAG